MAKKKNNSVDKRKLSVNEQQPKVGNRQLWKNKQEFVKSIAWKIIALSMLFGALLWVIDALLDYLFFYEGTFWELLIYQIPPHEVYIRFVGVVLFLVFGLAIAVVQTRRQRAEGALRVANQQLRASEQQLRAANQQLQASEQQLRAANQQLQASEQQLKAANQQLQANEQELKQTNHNLGERVKEMNCLYGLSQLVEPRDITLEEIFQGLLELIPPSWHYPEITCARVVFDDREFKTANFKKTKWKQSADIKVSGRKAGAIEIYYLKECPILDEGPFLKEERNLIDGISRAVGEAIQQKQAEETLRATNQQLEASEQQLRAANQQLQASEQQLKAANQQLQANNQQLRASQEEIRALAKFPSENPNPVLRVAKDGTIIYSNESSSPIMELWQCEQGERLSGEWHDLIVETLSSEKPQETEAECGERIYSLTFAPVKDVDFVNVYGLDITGRKKAEEKIESLARFPSENLNPVLRISSDGTLLYANSAADSLTKEWDCQTGQTVPYQWCKTASEVLSSDSQKRVEYKHDDRIFSFMVVPVTDAGYVNLYGRDITVRKQAEEERRAANQQLRASEQQLRASNQQLQASEQQLKASNQQLQASEQQLKAANQQLQAKEQELKQTNHNLGERVKELECLYGLSHLDEQRDITLEEIFQGLVELIPPGWQYPEITAARITFEDRHYKTANFRKTTWLQSADIKVHYQKAGTIEVCYLREMPTIDEGPFPIQERKLLNALAERLGHIAERIRDEEALEVANQQLRADEQQLKAANQQLQAGEQQLKAANQQLRANEQQLKASNQQLRADEQQLKAANQQLQASEQQLRATNQQLQAEIAERKKVEGKIKASLKEKEVLLKEIHHRVKNNMQLISSILNLQSKYVKDEQALAIFKNGQSRIRSMAFVHEKLYESEDLAKIDFAEYVRSITHYLFSLHEISPHIRLNVDIKDILLDVNTAIPCALIINELVSNALKYAFPEGIEGEICIQLSSDKDGKVTLIVDDNGVGFPKDLDFRKTESLGMQLIIMLVEQLEGTVELDKSKGANFKITF